MLFPTKSGSTNSWFLAEGFEDDNRVRINETVTGNNTDGFHLDPNDSVRLSIAADDQDHDTTCTNNFATSLSKGYVFKANDWTNIELTGFFKLTNNSPSDNEIILKGPTGEHHSNTTCCSGSSYQVRVGTENPVNFQHAKEMWHVNYDSIREPITVPGENYSVLGHGWFGVKFINYIKEVSGKKIRHLETWYNADGLGQIWKLVLVDEDTGGWGDSGGTCGGDDDQILAWGNARVMYRWDYDSTDLKFRNLSIREIDPFAQFDENPTDPENPDTNPEDIITFTSTLKLQRHINYNDGIGCGIAGGGGGGGSIKFYTVSVNTDKELSDSSTFQNRKRVVMSPTNSSSDFNNETPHQVDIPLKKIGTPGASPVINCKIWNSAGTVLYTSPTNLDPTTLTTSYVSKTFDLSGNTHSLVVGDRIGIEYTGTSSSNYVVFGYQGTAYPNTTYYQYEGTTWETKSRRLAMDVWT